VIKTKVKKEMFGNKWYLLYKDTNSFLGNIFWRKYYYNGEVYKCNDENEILIASPWIARKLYFESKNG